MQELLKHQLKEHGVKIKSFSNDTKSDGVIEDAYCMDEETGAILPESVHTIECKVCQKEFHAQSRNAVMAHLKKEHDESCAKYDINRYYLIQKE